MFKYEKLLLTVFLSFFLSGIVFAQKINIMLPQAANSSYVFTVSKGLAEDTIQKGTIGFAGNAVINIPIKYKDYSGMGVLHLENESPIHLIVNKESFSVERLSDMRLKFTSSIENDYFYSIVQDKKTPVANNSLYADRFLKIMQYIQQQTKAITQGASLMEKTELRQYAQNSLDVESLYTSGLWFYAIDNIVKMSSSEEALGNDMVKILKRIRSQEVFEALASDLITITEQFGLDDAFDIIVPYIQASGRIKVPQGKMFDAFTMAKMRKGMTAPAIEGYRKQQNISSPAKTIVIFYDPDCHNCEAQLEQLAKEYNKLLKYNIQIVSISSSFNKNEFEKDALRFPWSNKLCDFKGFLGNNFKNFGVISTPTIFLLDKENKILGRYALVSKMNLYD